MSRVLTAEERGVLDRMKAGMVDALLRGGSFTVEDGYRALSAGEYDPSMRTLGPMAVRQLKAQYGLVRLEVGASDRPERHSGYRARWALRDERDWPRLGRLRALE